MAINWYEHDKRIGYVCDFTAFNFLEVEGDPTPSPDPNSLNTINMCSAKHFPSGWSDDDGAGTVRLYEPRMSDLIITKDLGGHQYLKSGVIDETASFKIRIGGYDDDFWTSATFEKVLEGARITIRAVDRETYDEETIFDGYFDGLDVEFAPNAKIPIRAVGGPRLFRRSIGLVEEWHANHFRGDFAIASGYPHQFSVESTNALNRVRPVAWGDNLIMEATTFAFDWASTSGDVGPLTVAADAASCPSMTNMLTVAAISEKGTYDPGGTPVLTFNGAAIIRGTDDLTYDMPVSPAGNIPYVEWHITGSPTTAFSADYTDDHTLWIRGDWVNPDAPSMIDDLLFDSSAIGWLQLGSVARDTASWSNFVTAFDESAQSGKFKLDFAYPSVQKANEGQDLTTLFDVLREFAWWLGVDIYWDYSNYPTNAVHKFFFEKRETGTADYVFTAQDFEENSLKQLINPEGDYSNVLNISGGQRWFFSGSTTSADGFPRVRRNTKIVENTTETDSYGKLISKVITNHVTRSVQADFDKLASDRLAHVAQRQVWYEWKAPLQQTARTALKNLVSFQIGNFPTDVGEIRYQRIDYDRHTITAKASTSFGKYDS